MKNKRLIFFTHLFFIILLTSCVSGGRAPEPDFQTTSAEAVALAADTSLCTAPSGDGRLVVFPQDGRQMMINGFDFPPGDGVTLRLTAVTDGDGTQIERAPTVGDDGSFSETITLPQFDYMRWALRLDHASDRHCHFIVIGQDDLLEMGYEGPQTLAEGVQSPEEALEQDLAAVSEATGVSVEELRAQMAYEEAINALLAQLNANEADAFGGLWIERQPEYRIVVAFTEDGEAAVSQYIEPDDPLWDVLEVQEVSYSEERLRADQETLNGVMQDATFDWSSYVNIMTNSVILEVVNQPVWQRYVESKGVMLPETVEVLYAYSDEDTIFEPPANLNPLPDLYMAQRPLPSTAFEEALLMDALLIEDNCVFAASESGERTLIVWQPGYFAHDSGDGIQILNEAGEVVAQEGEILFMGGGGGALRDGVELVEPVPERCRTANVWYMGEFLPEAFRENVLDD